jgi:hypothetical protein
MNVQMESQTEFSLNQTFDQTISEKVIFNTVVMERI